MLTRRELLGTAAAAAAIGVTAPDAQAARTGELNILCWEGYNSAQVLDPFRATKTAQRCKRRIADQRSDHDQPAARRRDQCLGPDQRQQSLGAQDHGAREADQAARPRAVRALLRQDAAGLQAALSLGDERRRQRAARHGAAVRALQLRRQHRQDQPRDRRGPGLGPVERPANCRPIRHPRSPTTGTCSTSSASPASTRSSEHTPRTSREVHRNRQARLQGRQAGRRHRHDEPGADFGRDRLPSHRRHLFGLAGARRRPSRTARHHAEEGPDGRRQGRHRLDRDHLDGEQPASCRRWPWSSSNTCSSRRSPTPWPSPKAPSTRWRRWAIPSASSCSRKEELDAIQWDSLEEEMARRPSTTSCPTTTRRST